MSAYQLNKAIYRYLSPRLEGQRLALEESALRQRFDLTEEELRALLQPNIGTLFQLGVHPVLLNSYARARQVPRDRYRAALAALIAAE